MDPDSDGDVKLRYSDGSESSYLNIMRKLTRATSVESAEFARQKLQQGPSRLDLERSGHTRSSGSRLVRSYSPELVQTSLGGYRYSGLPNLGPNLTSAWA